MPCSYASRTLGWRNSTTEERLLGPPKAVLGQHLDEFLKEHTRGIKMAAANVFGLSRLSATTLVGLAMLVEAVGSGSAQNRIPCEKG